MSNNIILFRKISLGFITWAVSLCCFAQCPSHQQFLDKISFIDTSASKTDDEKLAASTILKINFEKCGFEKDSVYARILHRIGALQYKAAMYDDAIQNLSVALRINISGKKGASLAYAAKNYYNLSRVYYDIKKFNKVLLCNDSLISLGSFIPDAQQYIIIARLRSSNVYNYKGDYAKAVKEATLGLSLASSLNITDFSAELYTERAKANEMQQKFSPALNDINHALQMLQSNNSDNYNAWATAYSCKADILADNNRQSAEAVQMFNKVFEYRKRIGESGLQDLSTDNNNAGYNLLYKCNNSNEALKYFNTAYKIALQLKDDHLCATAYNNIAEISFLEKKYLLALQQYQKTLQLLIPHYKLKDVFSNPPHKEFLALDSKTDAEILMDNKSKCLLYLYKQTNNINYLKASLKTALLTDSIITDLRHEQTEDLSKLYWRNDTRDFFTRSLEASYLAGDAKLAFLFFEKSRAVLLNEKINELGAVQHLPKPEEEKQESLLTALTNQQQLLNQTPESSKEFALQQNKLFLLNDQLGQFIKSLELKYPAYYQYKYDDKVPSLKDLQQYLAKNNQSFVHYFFGDTATYILAITANKTNFIRLSQKDFNKNQLADFIRFCSNMQALNNHYDSFAVLSNSIYTKIFKRLQLPKGRIIICIENAIIPFDALCKDADGKNFLLNDYSFDYVYSARFLLKAFKNTDAQGNFVGFAPVSFAHTLGVANLKNAAEALQASADYYKNNKLFTHQDASRENFFRYASNYSVINIFSHARADTTDSEPVLFMQDSLIHLSELQRLINPATQLVLLSACQTNVGKLATGEGIYSLARGFATAGIPSISATLWKADEQSIYLISQKFNQYLSEGMTKDEALQKAKLYFVQNNSSEKSFPYYWANMILIGNADALKLSNSSSNNYVWIISLIAIVLIVVAVIIIRKKSFK